MSTCRGASARGGGGTWWRRGCARVVVEVVVEVVVDLPLEPLHEQLGRLARLYVVGLHDEDVL